MTIGSFTLLLNEKTWIAPHLLSWLPHLDEMVFYDGGSKDGTLEIIERFQNNSSHGHKIKLFLDKNPKDLQDDYVKLFDECLHELSTDLAAFLHPDFFLVEPGNIRKLEGGISYTMRLDSFAGDPGGTLYQIKGRAESWKNIYTLRPNLGLHYWGHYGSAWEDCYYREITGDIHQHFGSKFEAYPYPVVDSGIKAFHYSDVRPYSRRLSRMITCLKNQGYAARGFSEDQIVDLAKNHPRVSLKSNAVLDLIPAEYPAEFLAAQMEVASA